MGRDLTVKRLHTGLVFIGTGELRRAACSACRNSVFSRPAAMGIGTGKEGPLYETDASVAYDLFWKNREEVS